MTPTPSPVEILRELAAQAGGMNYASRKMAMDAVEVFAKTEELVRNQAEEISVLKKTLAELAP